MLISSSSHPQQPLLPLLESHNSTLLHIKQIHAKSLKSSPPSTSPQPNHALFFLYSRLIYHSAPIDSTYATTLLNHPTFPSTSPTSFCYNSLIRAHARSNQHLRSILLYHQMLLSGIRPDNHTFPFLLKSCAYIFAFSEGSQLHSHIFKLGLSADLYISNSLIHFYSSCGHLTSARSIFDEMPSKNQVSWNVIVDSYSSGGDYETALELVRAMMKSGLKPDVYTLQSVLCACAGLGSLPLGTWAHAYILKRCDARIIDDVLVNNSLLGLYSKCGEVRMARQVFDGMTDRDVASWNAMILGYAMHGLVEESVSAFEEMCSSGRSGLDPDPITFVAVLSACKNGGMVEEGRRYFDRMVNGFGLKPRVEHYGCMVDMLARKGLINEALELANSMDCKPDTVIWRSILDACCKNKVGGEVSDFVGKKVIESEEVGSSGTYVLLSKVYALANRWKDVGLVRNMMSEKGIKKEPGCSSIEMDGFVHEFISGDTSHPQSAKIYEKMNEIQKRIESVGYRPDSTQAFMVACVDGAKLGSLRYHSERLAIAFGLINLKEGRMIRVLKNLRVCGDCHEVSITNMEDGKQESEGFQEIRIFTWEHLILFFSVINMNVEVQATYLGERTNITMEN